MSAHGGSEKERHVIIGAGPAGLTAAWCLSRRNRPLLVLDKDPEYVGGLARTIEFKGYRFDIGPHRFYTKSEAIQRIWHEMLPDELITVDRLTRIFYEHRYFSYPIQLPEVLKNLGLLRSLRIGLSYLRSRVLPRRPVRSFEDWVVNKFGGELYATFFKTYTEKVWGKPCTEIDKDWAAQRIRGLSLSAAVKNALLPANARGRVKSLMERFIYPRRGSGQLWESVLEQVRAKGGEYAPGGEVVQVLHDKGRVTAVKSRDGRVFPGSHFYTSMPVKAFVNALDPAPPERILNAANALGYRDFMVAALLVHEPNLFPDQWLYVHDPHVRVARITNFENWHGADGTPDATTRLSMEYFSNRGDPLWNRDDEEIMGMAAREAKAISLVKPDTRTEGRLVRVPDAYPSYDRDYRAHRETLKEWFNACFENLYPIGRGGLHNYNSQDHAMMSSILSVRNMAEGASFDVWAINTDQEYAEEDKGTGRGGFEEHLSA